MGVPEMRPVAGLRVSPAGRFGEFESKANVVNAPCEMLGVQEIIFPTTMFEFEPL